MMHLRHRWKASRLQRVADVSFGEPGVRRTDIYERCERCGKRRVRSIDGWWWGE